MVPIRSVGTAGQRFPIAGTARVHGPGTPHRLYVNQRLRRDREARQQPACDEPRHRLVQGKPSGVWTLSHPPLPDVAIEDGLQHISARSSVTATPHLVSVLQCFANTLDLESSGRRGSVQLPRVSGARKCYFCFFFLALLEFNNMFGKLQGRGKPGAVWHTFAHHVLKPERTVY